MVHNYQQSENFNILTVKREKGFLTFTGEVKTQIAVGDFINFIASEGHICVIDNILERRDSKDYPEGNGYFYKVCCSPFPLVNVPR